MGQFSWLDAHDGTSIKEGDSCVLITPFKNYYEKSRVLSSKFGEIDVYGLLGAIGMGLGIDEAEKVVSVSFNTSKEDFEKFKYIRRYYFNIIKAGVGYPFDIKVIHKKNFKKLYAKFGDALYTKLKPSHLDPFQGRSNSDNENNDLRSKAPLKEVIVGTIDQVKEIFFLEELGEQDYKYQLVNEENVPVSLKDIKEGNFQELYVNRQLEYLETEIAIDYFDTILVAKKENNSIVVLDQLKLNQNWQYDGAIFHLQNFLKK